MKLSQRPSLARIGFTLIELLVVIAIIAVLMGLIIPASMKILAKGPQLNTSDDIKKLETAIATFQADFKVEYVPSRIKLCRKLGDYNKAVPLDADSVDYLLRLFPRCGDVWATSGIDWSGTGSGTPVVLEGHQCLVFFLGGIPLNNPPGCFGWSGNQKNPADPSPTGRKGPYFEFKSDRLWDKAGNGFFCYKDFYNQNDPLKDQPYAYFSSYGHGQYMKYGTSDCASLGVTPYAERQNPVQFYQPKGCQIISAGANRTFGQGGLWSANNVAVVQPAGQDDQTNFHPNMMGVGN